MPIYECIRIIRIPVIWLGEYILTFILLAIAGCCFSQSEDIDPDGYNKFYYNNGQLSSEGYMRDGKPDGLWKTYYRTGILKSEGIRKNFKLDSVWVFYDEDGDTLEKISYLYGEKNGYYYTYKHDYDNDSIKKVWLYSKELYVDGLKQGASYYYYPSGKIHKVLNFRDNKEHEQGKEYNENGQIITIFRFHNGYLLERQKINRRNNKGLKQGVWKEFHPNDRLKTEAYYVNGKLSGYYKEYDIKGAKIRDEYYLNGEIVVEEKETETEITIKNEYFDNGNIKYTGGYIDTVPVGMHKEYDESGKVIRAKEYDDQGRITGIGDVDEAGNKQGEWRYYYDTGELRSKGIYKDNRKTGEWKFYFKNGSVEQLGRFVRGRFSGSWTWYYETGELEREEVFENGKENGLMTEYAKDGTIIEKGEYLDGEKEGPWFYHVGDHTEEGNYSAGLKDGEWKHYYSNGKLRFEGKYVQGSQDGKHKHYYENGKLKTENFYIMGRKEKHWRSYDLEGNVILTTTYKNDKLIKVNGVRVKLPAEK